MLPNGKPHISYSEISTWIECSFRHFLQHVKKIDLSKPSIHLAFGTATHIAVQHLLKTREQDLTETRAYLEQEFEKHKENESFQSTTVEKLIDRIQFILDDALPFFDEHFPKWELVDIEESLYENIGQFYEAHNDASFKGFVDVILKVPKNEKEFLYWIIDLKTANRAWGLDKIKNPRVRMQLVLYKKFWSTKHNIPLSEIRCGFVTLLKTGKAGQLCKLIPVSVGEKSAQKSLTVLNNCVSSMKRGIGIKNRENCKYCDFKNTEHCP